MEHFGEFIDYDEGRIIDPREAFFAYAMPCESCGKPCDERRPATWDEFLQVGPCCAADVPQVEEISTCGELYRVTMQAKTVGELCDLSRAHKLYCRVCNPDAEEMREAA